ncbi:unnamed protein product [Meloidogyne enterolobii]|uniref:Uncharacterized protein n=1 Tax=Meloidogyne enterolobii TaxID=390850 RepID=A0ACB0YF11_MELEN
MKCICILIFVIFNSILWSLINSVKNNKTQNELNEGIDHATVNPQIQYNATVNPTRKITKKHKTGINEEEKKLKRSEYWRDYYQKHKNKKQKQEQNRIYYQKNKEKIKEERSSAKFLENRKKYDQKYYDINKEKRKEGMRKYRQRKKNEREIIKNESLNLKNVQSDIDEGTSFVNPPNNDFGNKGKLPVVCEENFQIEEENHFLQEEDEGELGTQVEEQNQIVAENPNKMTENKINLNDKFYPFDLNEKPEDE